MTDTPLTAGGQRLDGRVALITGASWGIGAAVAKAFARHGASVVVSSYPDSEMERLADEVVQSIVGAGGRATRLSADVTSREQIDSMMAMIQAEFGDVDVLPDGLRITPRPLHGGLWHSYADHRIATTGALIGLRVPGVVVEDVQTTTKTLPDFVGMWDAMVASASVGPH